MPEQVNVVPELWYPGQPLETPVEIPTAAQFRARFVQGVWGGQAEVESLPDSLSALRPIQTPPRAIAFLDMDDLVGNLGGSLRQLMYPDCSPDYFTHDYTADMFYGREDRITKNSLIRLVKASGPHGIGMQPVPEIAAIKSMIHSWRRAGVYVAVLTSALPGAELSHTDFIAKHFPFGCDGITITRAADGRYTSKGAAANRIVDFVQAAEGATVIALDDVGKNTLDMRRALQTHSSQLRVATFQHVFAHPSHSGRDAGSLAGATPFETFALANEYLEQTLGRTVHIPLPAFLGQLSAWEAQQADS